MSFSTTYKALRKGNTNVFWAHAEMATHKDESTEKKDKNERSDQTIIELSPDTIEERIKANLEPLQAQMSALIQMMD